VKLPMNETRPATETPSTLSPQRLSLREQLRIALRLHPALFAAALAVGALSIAIIRRAFLLGIPGEWT